MNSDLTAKSIPTPIRGRILSLSTKSEHTYFQVGSETHTYEFDLPTSTLIQSFHIGDLVQYLPSSQHIELLTPNRTPHHSTRFFNQILHPRRRKSLKVREQVETGIRSFFKSKGFHEVRTPFLVTNPGMEPHIRPFEVQSWDRSLKFSRFLPTSPEFAMKKLLVGGFEKIFQLAPSFRHEPVSNTHLPEFLMLEWYRAYSDLEAIQRDTEHMIESLALALFGKSEIPYQGKNIDVQTPWPRLKTRELFLKHAQLDLVTHPEVSHLARACQRLSLNPVANSTWDDLYFFIWLNVVEPQLPKDRAVFVTDYPASQAALSVIQKDSEGNAWAKRTEAYIAGLELANGFQELTHPEEQRDRFQKDMDLRESTYGNSFLRCPLDTEFMEALQEGLPPSGGIALGVDRLIMLFADETDIRWTQWLPQYSD